MRKEIEACTGVEIGDFCGHGAWVDVGTETSAVVVIGDDLHGFNCERFGSVTAKHGNHYVDDDFKLRLICGCAFNENIVCIKCNLGEISIDNWGKTEHLPFRVVDDRISRRISNNVQEFPDMFVILSSTP